MPGWLGNGARWTASRVPAALTLAALVALAFWGHRNGWRLPSWERDEAAGTPGDDPQAVIRIVPGTNGKDGDPPSRIQFPSADAVRKAGIHSAPAQKRTLQHYVVANGMVDYEPSRYTRLTSRTGGTVWRVFKEIGDRVRKGDVLALLDAADVGKFKSDLLQTLVQVKSRTLVLHQLQGSDRQGAVPQRSLQDAETALREARIRLFNDQQALLNLGFTLHIEDLEPLDEREVLKRLRLLGLPETIRQGLDPETLTANLLPLTAPFDGIVVERNAAPGEVIQMTAPKTLFLVADIRLLHVDLDVNPEDMPLVRVGQPVSFRPDGETKDAPGAVSHISPEVDEKTRRVRVHAETPNPDGRLRPNAYGTGRILVGEHRDAVVVPAEALQSDRRGPVVFVRPSETAFEPRPVEPGLRQGDAVEVHGVRAGEEVATRGSFLLKSELEKDRIAGGDE